MFIRGDIYKPGTRKRAPSSVSAKKLKTAVTLKSGRGNARTLTEGWSGSTPRQGTVLSSGPNGCRARNGRYATPSSGVSTRQSGLPVALRQCAPAQRWLKACTDEGRTQSATSGQRRHCFSDGNLPITKGL